MTSLVFLVEDSHANLQRNHVVCLAILFSCQRADFVERAAVCRNPPVRVKQNVSVRFSRPREAIPVDPDIAHCIDVWGFEKIELPVSPGPMSVCPVPLPVNFSPGTLPTS